VPRLSHPYAPNTFAEVASADVERWRAAGWLSDEPPVEDTDPDPKPARRGSRKDNA